MRRWFVVVALVLAVAGAATAVLLHQLERRDESAAADSTRPAGPTVRVTKETLVDERSVDGELAWGTEREIGARLTGTITWLPPVDSTVQRGDAIFRIDDRPVVLMYGAVPAYRELALGAKGSDVRQLERNLARLGMRGFTVDDEFTASTADAVGRWQTAIGLPKTGKVELGRVLFTEDALRVGRQLLSPGQVVEGAVLACTGTERRVTATLTAADRPLATPGTVVTIAVSGGKNVAGKVIGVAEVKEDGDQTRINAEIKVKDQGALRGVKDGAVRVRLIAKKRTNVLVLPVTALLALAEGGYGVETVAGTVLPVATGLFADGRVEVTGDGITAGLVVKAAP